MQQLDFFVENSIHFSGLDFCLSADDIGPELRAALLDCSGSGDAEPAVNYVLQHFSITGTPDDCAAYLHGYGAWDESELANHADNLQRLVWLAGCDLAERGEVYFSAY